MLLFFLAVLPIFIFLAIVYLCDQNKEPISLLLKLFLGGFLVSLFVGVINYYFDPIMYFDGKSSIYIFLYYFGYVAFIEEVLKWICVYFIGYKSKEYDERYDILLYSIVVSLGFAFLENIFYVMYRGYMAALLRAFIAVPAHLCYGTFMGYFLSKFKECNKSKYKGMSLVIPILIHGLYDWILFYPQTFMVILFYLFVILLFSFTAYILKKC